MEFILFAVSIAVLLIASNYFLNSAVEIARIFKMPEVIIGATIVALGTTLPETIVSSMGAFKGLGSVAYGNSMGSIICNTSLVAALGIAFMCGPIDKKSLKSPIVFFFFTFVVYSFIAIKFRGFNRIAGTVLISIFVVYVFTLLKTKSEAKEVAKEAEDIKDIVPETSIGKLILIIIVSAAFVSISSNILVDNGVIIAGRLGVPDKVIAITMMALGTSLPELVTTITAITKNKRELSIGNIIGANFLNLTTVNGISALVRPFSIEGINYNDLIVVLVVMLIMSIPPLLTGKTHRWQGLLMLAIYISYCIAQYAGVI